ncbi:MAG: hypothetical protein LC721_03895, partial [Actinobacteria bacterium]|nr:hypothetical protein [Actinomycetota bacterium]
VMTTADSAGAKQGTTLSYDPYGQALAGLPDNSAANFDYGWLGQHQRGLEHSAGIATIEMGAKQYVPALGRFLQVDPMEGGSCNGYDSVCGDPVNASDLAGTCLEDACIIEAAVVAATFTTAAGYISQHHVHIPYPHLRFPHIVHASRKYGNWIDEQRRVKPKAGRPRWESGKGNKRQIWEWDPSHGGEVEGYDRNGNHTGVFNPDTGEQIKPAIPGRTTPE